MNHGQIFVGTVDKLTPLGLWHSFRYYGSLDNSGFTASRGDLIHQFDTPGVMIAADLVGHGLAF